MSVHAATAKRKWHSEYVVLAGILAGVVAMLVFAGSYVHPEHAAFKNSFWMRRSQSALPGVKGIKRFSGRFDVMTPEGWHGHIKHQVDGNAVALTLRDMSGKPVPGLFVAARITSRAGAQRIERELRLKSGTAQYRAERLGLKRGQWDLAITGRDPESVHDTDLKFRIEKQIVVE